ncbi:MAG: hypothetical protein IT416_03920 [Candidatus Pacebacteria bacterium]|nr:hypothetical protein [Candidatus Paceibacterota bacterium]
MKLVKILKKINIYHLIIGATIVISFFFRFKNIENMVWEQIGNDESRDMLVAEHLVNYGETIKRGPFAAGGFNWIMNSPFYYYVVAIIWLFTRDPVVFMKVWAFFFSLFPLIGYLIGKELKDRKLGLIVALFFAINGELIYQSRQLLQPFFLPVWSSLFLLMILKTKKKPHYFYLSAAAFFLFIGLHFHYGVFLIMPVGIFLLAKFWFKLIDLDPSPKNIFVPLASALLIFLLWIFSTYKYYPFDQILFFIINFTEKEPVFLVDKIKNTINSIVWTTYPSKSFIFSEIVIFGLTLLGLLIKKDQDLKNKTKIVLILAGSAFFMFLSNGYIARTYLLSTLPFFLITMSIGIYQLFKINKFTKIIGLLLLTTIFIDQYQNSYYLVGTHPNISFYEQKKAIAEVIYQDYYLDKKHLTPKFVLAALEVNHTLPYDEWGTTGFLYQLEKLTQTKLVRTVNYGLNIAQLTKDADVFYFICDHRMDNSVNIINSSCLNPFIKARKYLGKEYTKIFESANFTVWKFQIIKNKQQFNYNYTYEELLN